MTDTLQLEKPEIPPEVNFVAQGQGSPIVLIHGLAASLHDWDFLVPSLVNQGYSTYALDLLGHGDSPKPPISAYRMDWLLDHFISWLDNLQFTERIVLVGHSLGGYLALEYGRRFPGRLRGLVLVNPFYSNDQLPVPLRIAYARPAISTFFLRHTPAWLVRSVIDVTSVLMRHRTGGLHALPESVRAQTASDHMRTSPAAYGILKARLNLTPYLSSITAPTLVVWGERDGTLSPASFAELVGRMPKAMGKSSLTGHVPHQADADWFNEQVLAFLQSLPGDAAGTKANEAVGSREFQTIGAKPS